MACKVCIWAVPCASMRLANIVGKIISMSLLSGFVSHLNIRALHTVINSRRSWCDSVSLPQNAKEELEFWFRNVDCLCGYPHNAGYKDCLLRC